MSKELIANDIILFDLEAETKQEIIEKLTDAMDKDGRLEDKDNIWQTFLQEKNTSSTAIGFETDNTTCKINKCKRTIFSICQIKTSNQMG